jgi:PAS domain S-box-containing protein
MGIVGVVPFAISAAVSAVAAVAAFSRRDRDAAALAFASIPLSHAIWTALNVGELLAPSIDGKMLFDGLHWTPGIGVAVGSLWFATTYAGPPPRRVAWWALLLIPTPVLVLQVVAPRWVHPDAHLRYDLPLITLDYQLSWLDWALTTYGFLPIAAASALLVRRVVREHTAQLRQMLFVFVGLALPPMAAMVALSFRVRVLGQRDPTPLVFGTADLIVAYGLFRTRLFDLAPLARDTLVARLSDAIVVCDGTGRIVDANPALERHLGIKPSDAIGKPAAQVFAHWPVLSKACSGKQGRWELELPASHGAEMEVSGYGDDHTSRFLDIEVTALRDRRGRDLGHALVLRDVTDRQRALRQRARETEGALRDAQQRFRAIIDHTFELIGLLDPQGHLLTANRTALEFAGLDDRAAQELSSRPIWETPWWVQSDASPERLRAAVASAAQGTFVRFEATQVHRSGERRSIDFSLKPVRESRGNGNGNGNDATAGLAPVVLLIAEGRDVTELRRAERENAALEERLHRARRLEAIGRLAGGVAHDFNNLITAILGSVEVIRQSQPAGGDPEGALEVIEHAAQSAAQLTHRLLAFGRRQSHAPQLVDPAAYLADMRPLLARTLGDQVVLTTRADPGIWSVRIDVVQLEQVFLNLAANARDAMPNGGRFTVAIENVVIRPPDKGDGRSLSEDDVLAASFVQMRFTDTGAGMSAAVLERIFEPFYTTKDVGKGTGLGLAAVYGIVRQSGGYIEARSKPGQGTELRLLLPRAEGEQVQFTTNAAAAP